MDPSSPTSLSSFSSFRHEHENENEKEHEKEHEKESKEREEETITIPNDQMKQQQCKKQTSAEEEKPTSALSSPHSRKKAALLQKRTISKTYLTKFESLRDFVRSNNGGSSVDDNKGSSNDGEEAEKKPLLAHESLFVAKTVKMNASHDRKKVFLFHLDFWQRLFVTLHRPASSVFSRWLSNFMMLVIIISCVFFVISSDPAVKSVPSSCASPACDNDPDLCPGEVLCEPVEPSWFDTVELSCIIVFTIDYVFRVGLVPFVPPRIANILPRDFDKDHFNDPLQLDPTYSRGKRLLRYILHPMNVIDLIAILPFYMGLLTDTESSVSVIRILRLGRMMRVFKVGKYNVGTRLLVETVFESLPALSLLCFFTTLLVVLFGALVYYAEVGTYTISADYPDGAYLRTNVYNNGKEESPFFSIAVSCWWVVVTMTTVGYGDMAPTTSLGRLIGVCCMLIGILALALPIGVMGSSFNRNYQKFHGKVEDNIKTRVNAADLSSIELEIQDIDMVYELNNEVLVGGEDHEADIVEGGENAQPKPRDGVELSRYSTVTAVETERVSDLSCDSEEKGDGRSDRSSQVLNSANANQLKQMSKREIRQRLKALTTEINTLMLALGDDSDQ